MDKFKTKKKSTRFIQSNPAASYSTELHQTILQDLYIYTWADHVIRGLIFFREIIIRSEMAAEWDTWQLCTSVCAKPRSLSPRIRSVEALG